jgi:toxin HigB-1
MIREAILSKWAERDLEKVPKHILQKFMDWVQAVEEEGLENVRKRSGYHDEPLRGSRKGQRSVRLSKAYRAIYVVREHRSLEFVQVEEVNKHDY